MIFTIGYQRLTAARLKEIVFGLDAKVFDVRHVPRSRKAGFGSRQLQTLLGDRYTQMGDCLGGRGHVTDAGFVAINEIHRADRNVLLMCLEEAPGDCHRHFDICSKMIPGAIHIYQDELFTAEALDAAFAAGPEAEYELCGSLSELL